MRQETLGDSRRVEVSHVHPYKSRKTFALSMNMINLKKTFPLNREIDAN